MNKLTLSAAALTAIVAPAQVQAADLTPDQIAAKQKAIDELRIQLNAAANEIESKAGDVKEEYLLKLSQITAEMNALYDDNTKDLTADQKNTWTAGIDAAKTGAAEAQKPYTAKKELKKEFEKLKTLYDARLAIAGDKTKYPNVSENKVKALKALGVEALGNQIDAYNPAETTILDERNAVETAIRTATTAIKNLTDKIAEDEAAVANNDAAHQAVVDAYNAAKADYNTQLQEAISKLPSDVYKDWQNEAVAKLNEQYRLINDAKKADEALYADGKSATAMGQYVDEINAAAAEIANIVDGYLADMQNEENAKADADAAVKYLQNALNVVKKKLADRELTDCDADIAAVQTSIDNLNAELDGQYKKHGLYGYKYVGKVTEIQRATNQIDDNGNPPHPYADVIDNYDAKEDMNKSIAAAQKTLNDNETAAKKASDDTKYNAADYFTGDLANVQKNIDDLSGAVDNAYKAKTAVKYQNETFASKLSPVTTGNDKYKTNTAAALAAYNAAQKTAADAQKKLDALKEKVADPTVTVDGSLTGTSYETTMADIQKEIDAINNAIAAALKVKDAAHLTAIQKAAKLTVKEDIDGLTEQYEANKAEYDKNSAVNAANAVLEASQNRIDAVQKDINSVTGDFGNQQEAINKTKGELQTALDKVKQTRDDAKTKFETVTDEAKKQAAAAEAIAVLAKVNEELAEMEETVAALKTQADAAKANKVAYDAVSKKADELKTLVEDVRDNTVMTVATGKAQDTYLAEITKMLQDIAAAKTELETAYGKIEAAAKQGEIEKKLTGIETAAKDLKAAVQPNENAHNDQVKAVDDLQKAWQTTYDTISNDDLSDAAAGYLQELAKLQESINNLKNKVEDAFGKCESVKQKADIEADRKAIEDAITKIGNESKDNYDANVDATNADQHSNFEAAYKTANTAFSDAVKALNQFSGIKNEAVNKALDGLIKTHDDIYAYADKLRKLKSDESADYTKYVNDVTDGVDDIYNAKKWIDEAAKFTGEINKLITDYQDAVNQVAYDTYKNDVKSAASKLGKAQRAIESFVYDGKATAFKDVEDVVNEAKAAGAIDEDGTIKDKFYAVKMDKWLETLYSVDDMLEADRDAACVAEKAKRIEDAKALYNSERAEIAGFGEINNADYIKKLDDLKESTIDVARGTVPSLDNTINIIIAKCEEYATYSLDKDGKYVLGHSSVYTNAYNESVMLQENIEAYNRLVEAVGLLVSDFDDVRASVEKLIVGHQSGTTYSKLEEISDYLAQTKDGIEIWKKNAWCVRMEEYFNSNIPEEFKQKVDELKRLAVTDEDVQLVLKIKEVKEEYNQAAKEDLDAVKEYDAKIDALRKAVDDIKAKFNKESGKSLDAAFGGAVDAFAEQEVVIAALNQELNSKYENTQTADAVAAVNAAIDKAEAAVAQAETWAGYNEATKAFAEADVQALRGELELIKADYETKNAAGQLLFYQDNILFELDNVLNDTPKTGSELEALYNKHVANDNVYNELSATLTADAKALDDAYNKIKDFEHKQKGVDEKYVIDTTKQNIEDALTALGESLETMHKAVELTETATIKNDINSLISAINKLERDAKHYEAMGSIGDLKNSIDASLDTVNKSQYGGDRQAKLTDEYNRINGLLTKADNYNNDAKDGSISHDIDGNDVREKIGDYWYAMHIDYNTEAWNVLLTRIAEMKADAEQLAKDVVNLAYITGDADNDKRVTVNDYSEVRNWILTATKFEDVDEAKRYAGDCNGDKEFTVADMTGVSNIIFHGQWDWMPENAAPAKTRAKASVEDEISITNEGEEITIFGKTVRMAITLTHSEAFTAGQMDIVMPQGMKIAGQSMSDRANGHDIFANDLGNGVTRIVAATIDNNEFNGRSGALIYLDVEVGSDFNGGQISIGNIIFSDAAGRSYSMSSTGGNGGGTTGIGDIKAATVKERIYSVGGQVMKTVKKGINIIVGEDGKTKKVVNK